MRCDNLACIRTVTDLSQVIGQWFLSKLRRPNDRDIKAARSAVVRQIGSDHDDRVRADRKSAGRDGYPGAQELAAGIGGEIGEGYGGVITTWIDSLHNAARAEQSGTLIVTGGYCLGA